MKVWMLLLAAFVFPLNAAAQTNLEIVVSTLKRERAAGRDGLMMYSIAGAGRAFLQANTTLKIRGLPTFYCPPGNFPLNASNYADIALEQYERDKSIIYRNSPWEEMALDALVHALLEGLQRTFPCK